jgi:hypothetical protein
MLFNADDFEDTHKLLKFLGQGLAQDLLHMRKQIKLYLTPEFG